VWSSSNKTLHPFCRKGKLDVAWWRAEASARAAGGPKWLYVESSDFRIAHLFRHTFPHNLDGSSALDHGWTRGECSGVFGIEWARRRRNHPCWRNQSISPRIRKPPNKRPAVYLGPLGRWFLSYLYCRSRRRSSWP